jgi:hypothetical protein
MITEKTKEQVQEVWDDCLLRSWRADVQMSHMVLQFLLRVNPDIAGKNNSYDTKECINYIDGLELKRCRDENTNHELGFSAFKEPVRGFVAARCQRLNDCLWNKDNTVENILDNISGFKWTRKSAKTKNKRSSRLRKEKNHKGSLVEIKARQLDKKHDWNIVK